MIPLPLSGVFNYIIEKSADKVVDGGLDKIKQEGIEYLFKAVRKATLRSINEHNKEQKDDYIKLHLTETIESLEDEKSVFDVAVQANHGNVFRNREFNQAITNNIIQAAKNKYEKLSPHASDYLALALNNHLAKSLQKELSDAQINIIQMEMLFHASQRMEQQTDTLLQTLKPEHYYKSSKEYFHYRADMGDMYHDIVLNDSKGMRLSDVYIEPHIYLDEDKKKNNRIALFPFITELLQEQIPGIISHEYKNSPRFLLLLGQPGQGKSSFCKRLLHDLMQEVIPIQKQVFFFRLRELNGKKWDVEDIFDVLCNQLKESPYYLSLDKKEFDHSILVLDGLDELAMQGKLQQYDIESFCKILIEKVEQRKGLQIIVTSRHHYVQLGQMKRSDLVLKMEIANTTQEEQRLWLEKYKAEPFHPECLLSEEKIRLIHQEDKYKHLQELMNQPILLHILATLRTDIGADINRAELYKRLFDEIVQRSWDNDKAMHPLMELKGKQTIEEKATQLREYIRALAFHIEISEFKYLHKSQLVALPETNTFLEDVLDCEDIEKTLEKNDIPALLRPILIAFYFSEKEIDNTDTAPNRKYDDYAIEFLHKSLYEYLAAEHIYYRLKEEFIKTDSKKRKYILHDNKDALQLLNSMLGFISLSREGIGSLIMEVIQNDTETSEKAIFAERLSYFLTYLLEKDFLESNLLTHRHPINHAFATFWGYCLLLSTLKYDTNEQMKIPAKEDFARFILIADTFKGMKQLSGFSLSYTNLSGANLIRAELNGAELNGANLIRAELNGAELNGAELNGAELNGAELNGASLYRTNLRGADLKRAKLNGADLNGADLSDAFLGGANLSDANLRDVNLRDAYLFNAILFNANLSDAYLFNANLSDVYLFNACLFNANLSDANLRKSDLNEANLSRANLSRANLSEADLSEADLSEANLSGADLSGADLSNLKNCSFEQLAEAKTLYNSKGLPTELEARLKREFPHLFRPKRE